MAVVPRFLQSAWRCQKRMLPSVRCISGLQSYNPSPPSTCSSIIKKGFPHDENILKSFVKGPSTTSWVQSPAVSPLMERMGLPFPTMSPTERQSKLKLPPVSKQFSFEAPPVEAPLGFYHINQKVVKIQAPQHGKVVEYLTIKMIGIRRKKMKKHQLKKFRKKFRIRIMTLKKKRFILRETLFLSGLEEEMKLAESFSAEQYAAEKLRRAYEPLPPKEKQVKPLPWEFQPLYYNSTKKDGK